MKFKKALGSVSRFLPFVLFGVYRVGKSEDHLTLFSDHSAVPLIFLLGSFLHVFYSLAQHQFSSFPASFPLRCQHTVVVGTTFDPNF